MAPGAMVSYFFLVLLTSASSGESHGTQNEKVSFWHIRSQYTAMFDISHLLLQSLFLSFYADLITSQHSRRGEEHVSENDPVLHSSYWLHCFEMS